MAYLDRLKTKWGITSNFQMVVVFIVFAITGSASLFVARPVLEMVGITNDMNPWIRVPLRIIAILPVYQVMLLEEYGDIPERPRKIEHWVYFPTEENRADFIRSVVSQGYQCENMVAEEENPLDYKLLVSREDPTTEENIDEVVLYLWETAQEFEGEYDGWETTVVRE